MPLPALALVRRTSHDNANHDATEPVFTPCDDTNFAATFFANFGTNSSATNSLGSFDDAGTQFSTPTDFSAVDASAEAFSAGCFDDTQLRVNPSNATSLNDNDETSAFFVEDTARRTTSTDGTTLSANPVGRATFLSFMEQKETTIHPAAALRFAPFPVSSPKSFTSRVAWSAASSWQQHTQPSTPTIPMVTSSSSSSSSSSSAALAVEPFGAIASGPSTSTPSPARRTTPTNTVTLPIVHAGSARMVEDTDSDSSSVSSSDSRIALQHIRLPSVDTTSVASSVDERRSVMSAAVRRPSSSTASRSSKAASPSHSFNSASVSIRKQQRRQRASPDRSSNVGGFPCSVCGKVLATSYSLTRHRMIHTGEKPFVCPSSLCKKRFTQKTTLVRHLNVHYKQGGKYYDPNLRPLSADEIADL